MIFKKPYAFFIKNFKLFHLILFVLSAILLYRTSIVYSFMKEFVKSTPNVIGKELTDTLFTGYSYILIVFMILINILLIIIMIKKVKPYAYYVINIALYISVLVIFLVSHRVIGNLEIMLVQTKTVLAVRDILNIARLLQTLSMIFFLVRATGFDIKKFDFGRDLHDLNISEEDSEEYEVAIEFEGNEIVRKLKKLLRDFKYYYAENKLIMNIIFLLFLALIFLLIYLNTDKYSKVYSEGEYLNAGTYSFGVKASYIINNDYKYASLSNNDYDIIAVKVALKSSNLDQMSLSRIVLVSNGYQYYHIKDYKNSLFDIGNVYNSENLSDEFQDYVFVYQVPKGNTDNLQLRYIDNIESEHGVKKVNSIDIALDPIDIDNEKVSESLYNLESEIDTTSSNIVDYKIIVNSYDISNKFVLNYNTCVSSSECYDFSDIIVPSVTTSRDKTLLKIDGNISYQNTVGEINNLYSLISLFGSIIYTYNGALYTESGDFKQVSFSRVKQNGIYYIEVDKELEQASDIKLVFNIRNNRYIYVLKGDVNE